MTKTKLAALVLMAMTSIAMADGTKPAPTPADKTDSKSLVEGDCARARKLNKTCVLNIDGESVDGATIKPNNLGVAVIDWGKAGSLIHIRRDFIPEIVKTAEDL